VKVLGVDPGGTTGVCLLEVADGAPAEIVFRDEVAGGIDGFCSWWAIFADHVVCESFYEDDRTEKPDLVALEIIGALKAYQYETGRIAGWNLSFQLNSQRGKGKLLTDAVLKRSGYYPPRGQVRGGHSTDATRHALVYVTKKLRHRPTIEKIWPKEDR
jgi:hypothetical protein